MSKISRALAYQIGGLILAALAVSWLAHHFNLVGAVERAQQRIGQMEWWSAVFYPLLIAGCNLLLLPGGVLALGSGLFFGLWWGFFLVLVGHLAGAAAAFWISRALGRQWVERKIFRYRKWMLLDEAITREGWKIIFLSQVHPLFPTSFMNYLYGVTRIPFSTCMLWIAVGQAPGLFLYCYLGTLAQLGMKLARRETHPAMHEYLVWFGGLAVTAVVSFALGRIALKLLAEAEEKSTPAKEPIDALANSER
ncbi:MAG: hypothetical protein QOD99_2381 [Chthoniobacter sp.]|jgi:uncharacterized membrane protein YdjX (TVP38/TMEM64 family)|nr:hypothetical protein [Chthoniobacter sp.]